MNKNQLLIKVFDNFGHKLSEYNAHHIDSTHFQTLIYLKARRHNENNTVRILEDRTEVNFSAFVTVIKFASKYRIEISNQVK